MAIDFSQLFTNLKEELFDLARATLKGHVKAAKKDTKDFLEVSEERLKKWSLQLANREISKDDFEVNLKGQKNLLTLVELKQAGLAKAKLDKFKDGVISAISSSVFSVTGL